jgi:hypothetical protein
MCQGIFKKIGIELGTFTYKKKPILLKSSLSFGI